MIPFLQLKKVAILYPQQQKPVFKDFSLDFFPGNVYALIGSNGSGKSTLLKAICNALPIKTGSILRDPKLKIGYVPEQCNPPGWLTIYRFMYYNAQLVGLPKQKISSSINALLNTVNLTSCQNRPIAQCSKGMRQRLCIAQALLGSPEILLLDEPFSGLDKTSIDLITQRCFRPTNNQLVIFSCHEQPTPPLSDINIFLNTAYHQPKIRSVNSLENMP